MNNSVDEHNQCTKEYYPELLGGEFRKVTYLPFTRPLSEQFIAFCGDLVQKTAQKIADHNNFGIYETSG
jgi:hypothetical protein